MSTSLIPVFYSILGRLWQDNQFSQISSQSLTCQCRKCILTYSIGETFCVGGLIKDIPNIEVIRKTLKIMGMDESMIEYVADRPGHDRRYSVDWTKIKKTLLWEPQYDFDTWLEKTIRWYKNNTNWWKPLKDKQQKYFKKQYGKK